MKIKELVKWHKSDEIYRNKVNLYNGAIVAIFTSGITIYMIIRGTAEGKKLEAKA